METESCTQCGRAITAAEDLEVEPVPVAESVTDGVPIFGGARVEDVYRCKGCGTPYALKNAP